MTSGHGSPGRWGPVRMHLLLKRGSIRTVWVILNWKPMWSIVLNYFGCWKGLCFWMPEMSGISISMKIVPESSCKKNSTGRLLWGLVPG